MKNIDPQTVELAREQVIELFGVSDFEVLDWTPVLHSGWEADSTLMHIVLPDGRRHLIIADAGTPYEDISLAMRERLATYKAVADKTQAILDAYEAGSSTQG